MATTETMLKTVVDAAAAGDYLALEQLILEEPGYDDVFALLSNCSATASSPAAITYFPLSTAGKAAGAAHGCFVADAFDTRVYVSTSTGVDPDRGVAVADYAHFGSVLVVVEGRSRTPATDLGAVRRNGMGMG